ncbi:MAG: hypothetical protein KDA96_11845 [Planctomycetaceae bacterium]|nr:hypothetical protein [Planctomycetaceae bacterium]
MMSQSITIRQTPRRSQENVIRVPCRVLMSSQSASFSIAPVNGGLCLPRGLCHTVGSIEVAVGESLSADVDAVVLNRWSDGSIRWLHISFIADFSAEHCSSAPRDGERWRDLTVLIREDVADASTCPQERDQQRVSVRLHDDVAIAEFGGAGIAPGSGHAVRLRPVLRDENGVPLKLRLSAVETQSQGRERHVTVIHGRISSVDHVRIRLRLTIWPSLGLIEAAVTLHNRRRASHRGGLWDLGDAGSFLFRSLLLEVGSECDSDLQPSIRWKATADQSFRTEPCGGAVEIVQHSSGGRLWQSTNHVDASGSVPLQRRGYTVECSSGTLRGYRAEPVCSLVFPERILSVCIPEFWQQFPAAMTASRGVVWAGLFPEVTDGCFELQGGERKTKHVLIRQGCSDALFQLQQFALHPPRLSQPPEWYSDCQVFPWFRCLRRWEELGKEPQSKETLLRGDVARLARYLHEATSGDSSMESRRETIDEYGWRNFGDLPADHEQPYFKGGRTVVSHYNNQFDLIFGGILNLAATGDARWFDLFDPLARHVVDIDIYHTDEDRAQFNGGLFWHTDHFVDAGTSTHRTYTAMNSTADGSYGGGPSNEHNYTTGLLHYYFLTGNEDARDAVISLADWVIHLDDGRQTFLGILDNGPTGMASCTITPDFQGPGRGAGNSLNALLDAWLLTDDDRYRSMAETIIRRCVHPGQDLNSLQLADTEKRWSYTVFLTSLGRYLQVCLERGETGAMYAWSRAAFCTYGRWMANHEGRTLEHPEKLEIPSEAWAAQDFRKANVLRLAAQCEDDADSAALMRQKADEINDAAWQDLYSWGRQHLTARCLSILMTEGLRDVFHRTEPLTTLPQPETQPEFPAWQMFVPQKTRVKQLLRSPAQLIKATPQLLRPVQWWRSLQALKRRLC